MPENLIVPLDAGNVDTSSITIFSLRICFPCPLHILMQSPQHAASTATNAEDEKERSLPLKKRKL